IGRDHTGVGNYYDPYASHRIFDQFPDLDIKAVKFNEIFYSKKLHNYVHENGNTSNHEESDKLRIISGTQAREILINGESPPSWFMRPEITTMILDALKNGKQVFETLGEVEVNALGRIK
ncbi:MAG: hypothetical protein JSV68_16205, partial [Anaerolineaceae bacterium]